MTPTPATSVTEQQDDAHSAAASTPSLSLTPATPLPWKSHHIDHWYITAVAMMVGDSSEQRENAEYAVHACNAYPKLVDARQQAVLQIAYMQSKFTATGTGNAVIAQSEALLRELGQGTPQENAEAK
jgi:hypothetical protein